MMKSGVQLYSKRFLMALIATIIGASVSSVSMAAGPACKALFSEAPILELSYSETSYSFLPEHVRLTRKSSQDYVVEYVYTVQGYPRLKKTELAMDSSDVVDANLNSGRELLNARGRLYLSM